MTQQDLDTLSKDLRTVAAKTLPAGDLTYGVFSADRQRMNDTIVTVVYRKNDRQPLAFNALAVMAVDHNGKYPRSCISDWSWSIRMRAAGVFPGSSTG